MAMRKGFVAVAVAVAICSVESSFCDQDGEYRVVFDEEFDQATLNSSRWVVSTGSPGSYGREAFLMANNVYLQNGSLVLRSTNDQAGGYNFTSGAVTSKDKASFHYGRVCVRAKLPGFSHGLGKGIWPAHWMMPNDQSCWPDHGEIDILEMINGDGLAHGTYHWNAEYPAQNCTYSNKAVSGETMVDGWADEFHEYATEWGHGYISFLVDSKPYVNVTTHSVGPPEFPPDPMYVILNTAVGGPWPGPADNTTRFPAYHHIDYVRVSQKSEQYAFFNPRV